MKKQLKTFSYSTGLYQGRRRGLQEGHWDGYRLGRCEGIVKQLPEEQGGYWDIRLLYVTTGLGLPFSPLDEANMDTLRGLVRELHIATPADNVAALAQKLHPDLMIVFNGHIFPVQQVDAVRALGIKTAIWFTDDPYAIDGTIRLAPHYDVVFTLELSCVSIYEQAGCHQVEYLPLGMNPAIFHPMKVNPDIRKEVSFIGSAYWNRVHYIDPIAGYLSRKKTYISGIWWERLKNYRLLRRNIHKGWMSPEQTAAYYNGSKIVVNLHRSHDLRYNMNSRKVPAYSPNPRMFEIAGCGTLQLTDERSDLARFYTPGSEIITYASPKELTEIIDYYLKHEDERLNIALRGLERTRKQHTYRHRWCELLQRTMGSCI